MECLHLIVGDGRLSEQTTESGHRNHTKRIGRTAVPMGWTAHRRHHSERTSGTSGTQRAGNFTTRHSKRRISPKPIENFRENKILLQELAPEHSVSHGLYAYNRLSKRVSPSK